MKSGDGKNDLDRIAEDLVRIELKLCGSIYPIQPKAMNRSDAVAVRVDDYILAIADLAQLYRYVKGLAETHHALDKARHEED